MFILNYLESFLNSAPIITNTFNRILTCKCLCKVWFWYLINMLKKQDQAERALDFAYQPQWFVTNYDPRVWAGMYVTRTDIQGIQFPW